MTEEETKTKMISESSPLPTESNQHPEWSEENSLTSFADRDLTVRWKPSSPCELNKTELKIAATELNNNSFTKTYPRSDRTYADPDINLQRYGLVSFVPAKGATPNKNGVFGFAKMRGNYSTEVEANQRAEFLIRTVDSYHKIYHTYVGRPFPITTLADFSKETVEVDMNESADSSFRNSVKTKKKEDEVVKEQIRKREKELLDDTQGKNIDPYERYTTLNVKRAQLTWTYIEKIKQLVKLRVSILKCRDEIEVFDDGNPQFKEDYYEKYIEARKESGFKDDAEELQKSFIQYMLHDAVLPGIDTGCEDIFLEKGGDAKKA
jgi:hypothetical protein